jgi:N-acetylglutamate synthase-like GNAT family acetyltransferase
MDDDSKVLSTRTGFQFCVRPARPNDEAIVAEFFTHVTHEDLRFRFLSGLNVVPPQQITALTHVDHRQTENFLAFTADGATMIATAMLACDDAFEHGEVALAIRGDQKHKGVSWEMLAHVARHAEALGVHTLESIESRDNRAAIELERNMGFTTRAYPGDATLLLVSRTLEHKPKQSSALEARSA